MPGKRTPRTWQWAVKTEDGYSTDLSWMRGSARFEADCRNCRIGAGLPRAMVVKVEVRELPAARQRRGR
jgi:hypothetical protein